ncbi:vascular endothelial growth factor receptor kdr-like isoform X2 [Macrobrachium rosenbergii]|uniref:vascular endothelial growth factor receptor kdr-like isoform X2 n=1 Tax=Macrobrachium rosenbergii TaxID=79674 RepID=UPI0034D42549
MRELEIFILLLVGSSFTVRGQTGVKPPRTKQEKELFAHENATLVCEGDKKLVWTLKYHDREIKLQEKIQHDKVGETHVSKLQLDSTDSQGHYYCHYENTSLSDLGASAGTYVYLFSQYNEFAELEVSEKDAQIRGKEGDQVVLDCRPTHPNLTVVVEHDGKEIHQGPLEDPRVGFVLRNLTKEHRGDYLCKIHEEEGKKEFKVEVLGPPKRPWLNISMNTYPVVGYDMELHCRILDNYHTEPTFTWIQPVRDTRTSQTTKHHPLQSHMFYTNYLRVRNVTLKDSGTYNCVVNIQGMHSTNMSSYIIIKETEDPFVDVKPVTQNLTCSKGDNVTWELEVESFPPKPRFQLSGRFIHKQFENGTNKLTIKKVAPSDFGEHTVTITTANYSSGIKTTQAQLYLIVLSETELKITGIRDTTEENATITATCNATGYPLANITWQYQSCPGGECPNNFRKLTDDQVTYAVHKENRYASEYTFVAQGMARIKCLSGKKEKIANIAVSEFQKRYSFKHSDRGVMKDLKRNSSYTSIETDPFNLICAASRFYFQEVRLNYLPTDNEASSLGYEEIVDMSTDLDLIKTLAVANVSSSHKGKYVCVATARRGYENKTLTLNHEVEDLIPVFLMEYGNMLSEDYVVERRVRDAFTFNCSVSGTPAIDITWTKDDHPLPSNFGEFRENNQTITISDLNPTTHRGRYACEARNRGGSVRGFLTLIVHGEGSSKALKVSMGIITPFLICLVVVVIVLFKRVRRDFLTRKETKKNLAFLFERGRPTELNPDCTADEQAELLPYDHKWEVSRERIQLGQQLGAGAFGRVVKACVSHLEPGVPKTTVALKMSKTQADPSQIRALTQELKIMVHIGKHLNIVNLLGSYTANVSKGELWILVEYCRYGSLLPFLHRHRHNFQNLIDPVTDMVDLTWRDGEGNISPFSPVHVSSPASPKSPGSSFKSPSVPQSPTHSEKDGYESAQTASSAMYSGTRRPCETLLESPTSPTVPFSPSHNPKEESMDEERRPSSPKIFRFGDSLPTGMKMVQNPSYQTVPVATPGLDEGSGSHNTRKQSLKVLDSQGNYFMYDKSTIPGVTSSFTTVDLICWSWQVAEGMDYLTRRKVLHGDLAARNLLLAEANVVKISDFGLSRDIYMDDIYFKQTNDLLPVKWMSTEAIRDRMFSIQSDIWSFGVTLWELFSLGSTPYPGVKIDHTFLLSLQDGYRMAIPEYANGELYKIMCQCWESVPQERPSFRYLADRLSKMLMPETTQHYNNKNGEYLNMNEERFKHEKDYLEMLASPDIRNVTRDDVSQCEDAVDGTRKANSDLRLYIESTSSAQPQETNYLPMSSCAGSPQSPFDIFSPTKPSESGNVFTFGEEVQRKNSNPARQSCPQRGNPFHYDTQPSHQSLGDLRTEEGLTNQQGKADEPPESPNGSLRDETGDELSESSSLMGDNKTCMTRRPFSQESQYINIPLAPDDSSSPPPSPEITLKMPSAGEVAYANLQTVR